MKKLTPFQIRILLGFEGQAWTTVADMADRLDCAAGGLGASLRHLALAGIIEQRTKTLLREVSSTGNTRRQNLRTQFYRVKRGAVERAIARSQCDVKHRVRGDSDS